MGSFGAYVIGPLKLNLWRRFCLGSSLGKALFCQLGRWQCHGLSVAPGRVELAALSETFAALPHLLSRRVSLLGEGIQIAHSINEKDKLGRKSDGSPRASGPGRKLCSARGALGHVNSYVTS